MAARPLVQNLNDIINEIQTAYKPQQDLLDQSINQNEQAGQAQQAGLEAKKTESFGGIAQTAQNRGMNFSGFTPDAQAKYTGSTYLPALAQLQATIAGTRNNLLGKKADISATGNTKAIDLRRSQQAGADAYDQEQEKRAYEAEQARIAYERQVAEQRRQEAASLIQSRSSGRSKTGNNNAVPPLSQRQLYGAIGGNLAKVRGGDGYVSPDSYAQAKADFIEYGYSGPEFDSQWSNLRNPQNPYYQLG